MVINVGIVGSAFNLKENEIEIAKTLGKTLADNKSASFFICYDKESLPIVTGKEMLKNKKVICFVTDNNEEKEAKKIGFEVINLNLPRMFREIIFVNNIDLLIVCGGGSGTLMEITFAYQLNKQIYVLNELNGSVDAFKDKFLDKRERVKIKSINLREIVKIIK